MTNCISVNILLRKNEFLIQTDVTVCLCSCIRMVKRTVLNLSVYLQAKSGTLYVSLVIFYIFSLINLLFLWLRLILLKLTFLVYRLGKKS